MEVISKLLGLEMDLLRRSARHSKLEKIRNKVIRQHMNKENSILDFVQYRQLEWYGHVKRMNDGRSPRRILDWISEGWRGRSRPQNTVYSPYYRTSI